MADFHVSTNMATEILDTRLHTRFAIFLYSFRLESVMLTKLAILDAADAERLVLLKGYKCGEVMKRQD